MRPCIRCFTLPVLWSAVSLSFAAAPDAVELPPVVVTGSPLERTLFEQVQPVSLLEGERLTLSLEPSLGETLSGTPGVRSSYFGPAASRPVIRGLDASRVRILQNGLNSIDASSTSADHAVSFDPVSVERIEVVRGPATLLYGSQAIGGVVNAIDNRIPDQRIDVPLLGSLGTRYRSMDNGISGDLLFEGGAGGFAWHFEAFHRDHDDLHIPGFARSARLRAIDPLEPDESEARGVLPNSFLSSRGLSAGASRIWDTGYFGMAYSIFDSRYGSPAEENVIIEMDRRQWDFHGAFERPVSGIESIKYRLALADYEHTEFEGAEAGTVFMNQGHDGRIEVRHSKAGPFEGTFGIQSERSDFSALGAEAFLPKTLTHSYSGFVFEEASLGDQFKLQGGLRFDHISAHAEADPRFGPERARSFNNVSGSLGLLYEASEDWSAALSLAQSKRAPSSQELYALGPHVATGVFEIGDDQLQSEQAFGLDLSLRKRSGPVTGSLSGFYNRFHDFIGQFPTGAVEVVDGEEFPVYVYRNTGAEFWGMEAEVVFHLLTDDADSESNRLDLELKADFVHARDTRTGDPLPRISPFHASLALDYHSGPFGARLEGVYSASQHRVSDNELPTDSYCLLNAALTYTLISGSATTSLFIKGVNLTNQEAREHTSFLKDIAPLGGRGVVAGIKVSF